MRSILVEAGRDAGMAARLDTAMAIARANAGHVTVLVDTPVNRFVTADPYGGASVASEALNSALVEDDALAAGLIDRLEHDDVPFDVARFELEPVNALAIASRLSDLVVVSRGMGRAGDLALASRCPVLALADGAAMACPPAVVCIAWDGGEQAAFALRSAVPLLVGAGAVHVLTAGQTIAGGFPQTEALRYLSRHGIKAELHELLQDSSVEQTLADAAAQLRADLLVMGAYGHSRVREFLFGGVSRYFLETARSPALLLAH